MRNPWALECNESVDTRGAFSTRHPVPRGICVVFLLALLTVQSFPGHYRPISTSLDPAYQWAFNYVDNSPYIFGKDVVYTYGPLGYLVWPLDVGNNLWHSVLFRLVLHLLFIGAVAFFAFRIQNIRYVVFFFLGYVLSAALKLTFEYQLMMILILWMGASIFMRRGRRVVQFLAGGYAAMLLLTKFNAGIAAISILLLVALMEMRTERKKVLVSLSYMGAGYVSAMLIFIPVYFRSAATFLSWLHQSWMVAGDYSEAMSYSTFDWGLTASLACLAVYVVLCLWLLHKRTATGLFMVTLAVTVFFAFKHGNIRQVGMALAHMFSFYLAILSVLMLIAGMRREPIWGILGAYLIVLALTVSMRVYPEDRSLPAQFKNDLLGGTGTKNIESLIHFGETRDRLARESQKRLLTDRIFPAWIEEIKNAQAAVDVIPWEISMLPANGLAYVPNPVFQLFEAYTPSLDARVAAHFAHAAKAPGYVIWHFEPAEYNVDNRCPLWDPPLTIRTLFQYYSVAGVEVSSYAKLLLKRREQPDLETMRPFAMSAMPPSAMSVDLRLPAETVSIPAVNERLYMSLDIRLTLLGKLMKFLYRVPPVYLHIVYQDGSVERFHLIPALARAPMIMDYLPRDIEGLARLFEGRGKPEDRCVGFALSGPGLRLYVRDIRITWYKGMQQTEPLHEHD